MMLTMIMSISINHSFIHSFVQWFNAFV